VGLNTVTVWLSVPSCGPGIVIAATGLFLLRGLDEGDAYLGQLMAILILTAFEDPGSCSSRSSRRRRARS
jgi:hypothetical protein